MIAELPLIFTTEDFVLEIDPMNGDLRELKHFGVDILKNGKSSFALALDGWHFAEPLLSSNRIDNDRLTLCYDVFSEDGRKCSAKQIWEFSTNCIERTLFIQCDDPGLPQRLLSASLSVTGLVAGTASSTQISVPMARSLPGLNHKVVASRDRDFSKNGVGFALETTGLDVGLATAIITCDEPLLNISVQPVPHECPVKLSLYGDEGRLALTHEFICESWLECETPLQVARQVFLFSAGPWQNGALAVAQSWQEENYTPPADRSNWAKEAIILEVDPAFYGGLQSITQRLDEIHDLGFNTLYLMPWHPGHWNGYGTYRYNEINPAYGSFADLRALSDAAHERGLRVLFDLLVNVAGEDSPYPIEHPEWFYRDPDGRILHHPAWKSWCFDPASPGFRKYLTDYAVRCCTEWGADGFRVDAAAYRGGSWNNLPGVQPHQHAHAIFTLLDEIRTAIRVKKPDAICMAECFGPSQVPISDLVAYQWVAWLDWVNAGLLSGQITGASLSRILGEHLLTMPLDTWLVGYTHTHDTIAFEKRDLDGPAIATFFATLNFLCAGTMVFGGGWEMRQRPSASEAKDYRRLFEAKKALGGLSSNELAIVENDNSALLVIERPSRVGKISVVSNFSEVPQVIPGYGKPFYSRLGSGIGEILPYDTIVVPF